MDELKGFENFHHKIELTEEQQITYFKTIKNSSLLDKDKVLSTFSKLREVCDLDPETKESSKLNFILELIEKIEERKEKAIVFSFWIKPLEELKNRLNKIYGEEQSILFTGALTKEERNNEIDEFKKNDKKSVLLCSGKIGGEGLNLTEANHAIFLNHWWNPSNNNQARDRIIRIGQLKKSYIHHLYSTNTIEDKLRIIIEEKKELNFEIIEKLVFDERRSF